MSGYNIFAIPDKTIKVAQFAIRGTYAFRLDKISVWGSILPEFLPFIQIGSNKHKVLLGMASYVIFGPSGLASSHDCIYDGYI